MVRLHSLGVKTQTCNPAGGDRLPPIDDRLDAVVVYGGVQSANDEDAYIKQEIDWIGEWASTDKPFLGICLGAQLLARASGETVARHAEGQYEIGFRKIIPAADAYDFMPNPIMFYQWHKEGFTIPTNATRLATGDVFENQAYAIGNRIFGLQFHPDVTPPIMNEWLREASERLLNPGADQIPKQQDDAKRFDPAVDEWLNGFIDRWRTFW